MAVPPHSLAHFPSPLPNVTQDPRSLSLRGKKKCWKSDSHFFHFSVKFIINTKPDHLPSMNTYKVSGQKYIANFDFIAEK